MIGCPFIHNFNDSARYIFSNIAIFWTVVIISISWRLSVSERASQTLIVLASEVVIVSEKDFQIFSLSSKTSITVSDKLVLATETKEDPSVRDKVSV